MDFDFSLLFFFFFFFFLSIEIFKKLLIHDDKKQGDPIFSPHS